MFNNLHYFRLHAWGDSLKEAFEQCVMSMYGYMTEIDKVDIEGSEEIEAQGQDLPSLLFHFLDEFLFLFSAEPFFIARVSIQQVKSVSHLVTQPYFQKVVITEFDLDNFKIRATAYGETFNLSKHPQGTEVKAITYSNMQIHEEGEKKQVFVIIDI